MGLLVVLLDTPDDLVILAELIVIYCQRSYGGNVVGTVPIEEDGMEVKGGQNICDGKDLHFVLFKATTHLLRPLRADDGWQGMDEVLLSTHGLEFGICVFRQHFKRYKLIILPLKLISDL